jgi:hypothetical protein
MASELHRTKNAVLAMLIMFPNRSLLEQLFVVSSMAHTVADHDTLVGEEVGSWYG